MAKGAGPNIQQVAALAGVSTATVSRTLQEPDKVREATRNKVLAAVQEMNFVSNAQARSFRQQSTRTVILLVRDIGNPFYLEIFKGVEEAASESGYKVLMGDARDDKERVGNYIDMVRQKHADGLILMIGTFPHDLTGGIDRLPPIVIASETFPGLDLPTVKVDNVSASRGAVNYLIANGHREIAHLAGPLPERLAVERRDGYRMALEAADLRYSDALVVAGDYSIEAGREAIRRLTRDGVAFSAVFAASDQMAIGAIGELRTLGLTVPGDISVIGFDDILLANAFEPPLTTVRQPRREMGRQAMLLMINRLQGNTDPEQILLETDLVIRHSVAAKLT